MRQGRGSEANEAVFCRQEKKSLFIPGCVQGANIQLVCVSVWVTFVVFTDCESCTRPISGSMEAREYGLTRGTCFLAFRLY